MTTKELKPVRTISGKSARATSRRRIRKYELRYEMPTEKMRELVRRGKFPETDEIAKWLHEANVLALLERRAKNTAGSASSPTRRSTKAP